MNCLSEIKRQRIIIDLYEFNDQLYQIWAQILLKVLLNKSEHHGLCRSVALLLRSRRRRSMASSSVLHCVWLMIHLWTDKYLSSFPLHTLPTLSPSSSKIQNLCTALSKARTTSTQLSTWHVNKLVFLRQSCSG